MYIFPVFLSYLHAFIIQRRGMERWLEIRIIKEFRNADIYEIGDHEIRIPHKVQYSFRTENNETFSPEEENMLTHKTITIKH